MNRTDQAKLYYLYMLSDGEASEREKKLFTTICKELSINPEEKKGIIKECESVPYSDIVDEIKKLVGYVEKKGDGSAVAEIRALASMMGSIGCSDDHATMLWNLVNLGYADTKYTSEEHEIVDLLKEYWEVADDLYQEMIDVAETCLALEEHKKWVDALEESPYKAEKLKQIKKDIKMVQDSIKVTLAELDF
ncbi:MAG: hypothetical protein E7278_09655 [Lachnospiraceae bacterium]|nr:hypothetical protein [Lachnospiraceae bacterium]